MEMIQEYEILEKISDTRNSIVYRGRKPGEKNTVIIKTLKMRNPAPSEIAMFKQEYEIIKNIELEGVVKTYGLIDDDDRFALVLEDFDGVSLKSILNKKKIFEIKHFLDIALKITNTLGELHKRDIIHKDIKPNNILINTNSGQVKITDFGIASILTRENSEIYYSDVIQGTLTYMSPEQTGRMNRIVDYRTDLYSLGVTFYEMITGTVPFDSTDPLEIIHSHIAKKPTPPVELDPGIPQVLSDLIMMLLSKNAENRYQNSFGILADLEECMKRLKANNTIEPFELAQHDISTKFIIPQRLFGREKEMGILLSAFDRVNAPPLNVKDEGGAVEIMLVTGSPGVGKSSIINEMNRSIAVKRGYFISGKYEQFRRDKPYSAIIQAFQELAKQILSESEERIKEWKKNLLEFLGPNGKIITDIIPEIEFITGPQADLHVLAPVEAKNRFNLTFENFFRVFAKKEHPVTLFLDDLQWADLASLQLIKKLVTSPNIRYLFLIGSYRDNEVSPTHPLAETLNEIEASGIKINRLPLKELTIKDIRELVVSFLKSFRERELMLADMVFKKTNGNPFFVTEILHTLYNEKIIEMDAVLGWKWDMEKVDRIRITDNVVELMADKIKRLPERIQNVLKICACMGHRFDLETLSIILAEPIEEVLDVLTIAMNDGFIGMSGGMFIFHHDRIQEAAYSLIHEKDKPSAHFKIGKFLLDKSNENELQEKLFYITDQLNFGSSLVKESKERERLAKMNLECGKKAASSIAYTPALWYLEIAMGLLEDQCWEKQYDLTLAIYSESVEVAFLKGDYDKMNGLAETTIRMAKTVLDKVIVYKALISAHIAREDIEGALSTGMNVVRMLGNVNTGEKSEVFKRIISFKLAFIGKSDEDILKLPDMTDPIKLSQMEFGAIVGYALYATSPMKFISGVFRNVRESLKYGLAPEHSANYLALGLILISGFGDIEGGYRFGNLGMRMAEKPFFKKNRSKSIMLYNSQVRHWKEHLKNTIEPYIEGYQVGLETGDLLFAVNNLSMRNLNNFMLGKNLTELQLDIEKSCEICKNYNQQQIYTQNAIIWQLVMNLLGKSDNPVKMTGSAIDEEKSIPQWTAANNKLMLGFIFQYKLFLDIMFHHYSEALKDSEELKKYFESSAGTINIREFSFLNSLAILADYSGASGKQKRTYRKKIKKNLDRIKKWAKHAPMNNLHRLNLIMAERARVLGKNSLAEKYYDISIELSNKYKYPVEEMYANELAARYYLSIGKEKLARAYMAEAYHLCHRWGATAKLKHMLDIYPGLLSQSSRESDSLSDSITTTVSGTMSQFIDLSTVVKASQAISGEVAFGKLLGKMMKISIENAGAEKGYMILEEDGKLFVQAEGTIESEEVIVQKSIPVDLHEGLSPSIVNYVARTKEALILNNASSDGNFTKDPYVVKNNPASILCIPIINQGRLSGILYLENKITKDAFTQERLDMLNMLSSQMAISLDNAKLYENLEKKVIKRTEDLHAAMEELEAINEQLTKTRDALWGEMELAKKIQTVLLPEKPSIKGYEITGYMWPADEVGGDYYDVFNIDNRDWVIIGDVSGHGLTAGLVMMMVQTAIRAILNTNPKLSTLELLIALNTVMQENIVKLGENKYMTITVLACHEKGKFLFSGMHQDILIYRADTREVELRETSGMWIGIFREIRDTLTVEDLSLNPGDIMLLYSDGITEAFDKKREMFSKKKLVQVFKNSAAFSTEEIKNNILKELDGYDHRDDVTLVVLRRL